MLKNLILLLTLRIFDFKVEEPEVAKEERKEIAMELCKVIVFELNGLEVYALQTMMEFQTGVKPTGFYWRDPASPQGYGPFEYISTAVEHYKHTIRQPKLVVNPNKKPGDLIRVDFLGKRRV